jgi:hypothetical protein
LPGRKSHEPLVHDFGSLSAVADVYDALSSDRPYRAGYHPSRALEAIARMSGTHLNAEAVEILRRVIPPFPVCSEVRVLNGPYAGYAGIIADVPPKDITHPVVRILNDSSGRRVDAVQIDLAVDRDVRLAPIGEPVTIAADGKAGGLAATTAANRDGKKPLPPAVQEFLAQFNLDALECAA